MKPPPPTYKIEKQTFSTKKRNWGEGRGGTGGREGGEGSWNSLRIITFPWQQASEAGGLGRGVRRERGRALRRVFDALVHCHGNLLALPIAKVRQDPRNGLGRGPRRGWAGQSSHACPILSPVPASPAADALVSARQSQIWPSQRVGGSMDQQMKQPGQEGRSKVERGDFSDSHWFVFHLSRSIWTTQMSLFSHPRWL